MEQTDEIRVLDHGFVRLDGCMADDLSVVNGARVSFAQRAEEMTDRDAGLIRFLMRERHGSPFEHNAFRFHVKLPIFVMREWARHRIGCLTGDTEITFVNTNGETGPELRKTIDELWRMWSQGEIDGHAPTTEQVRIAEDVLSAGGSVRAAARSSGISKGTLLRRRRTGRPFGLRRADWRVRGMRLRVLNEESGEFEVGHICDVVDKGLQPVYELTLADGKKLKLTENHRVLTDEGWATMGDAVGLGGATEAPVMARECSLMVNGVPAHQDRTWMAGRRQAGLSVAGIAAEAGCSYHTVRKWLRIHDLQFSETERSFASGHVPWNKGKAGYKIQYEISAEHRAAIQRARSGERSNFWRGGVASARASMARWTSEQAAKVHAQYDYTCQECKRPGGRLHAHHIVPVWRDPSMGRQIGNLITLCASCHRRVHRTPQTELAFAERFSDRLGFARDIPAPARGYKLVAHPVKVTAIRYVGIRQTYDLSVEGPWHNFVANGIVAHNSFNEWSGRYSQLEPEFYVPAPEDVRSQVGKPGSYSFETVEPELAEHTREAQEAVFAEAYRTYEDLLERGVAKEIARNVLPVAIYTQFYWTVNARSLMNFLSLRNSETAQREIRRYAEAVEELFASRMPITHAAFVANERRAP
jgi:thymidylate synthase (FAD)